MADEVPITDVLCDAMEYLSKLGSNLQSRSKTLKEKRIRKDKLKNSHAVQKAADKVLLICELSKKSLENVESGMRQVLSLVKERYHRKASNKPKQSTSITPSERDLEKIQYFRYQSWKLKISKKVPVKHYMSVKVLARNMPLKMQEKYPVYYNCKLYRQRSKMDQKKSRTYIKDDNDSLKVQNSHVDSKADNDSNMNSMVLAEKPLNNVKKSVNDVSRMIKDNQTSVLRDSLNSRSDVEQLDNVEENCNVQCPEGNQSQSPEPNKSTTVVQEPNKTTLMNEKKRYKHIMIMDDSSEQSNDSLSKENKFNENEKQTNSIIECNIDNKSCQMNDESQKVSNNLNKNPEIDIAVDKGTCKENEESQIVIKDKCKEKVAKPMLKCVNISTLLKPDVLQKSAQNIISKNKQKEKMKNSMQKAIFNNKDQNFVNSAKSDEEYWACKRKEVEAFKPKQFSINIDRLPKFTAKFLMLYNIKRIMYKESMIYELHQDKNSLEESHKTKSDGIYTIKTALLNDSESDKSDHNTEAPLDLDKIEDTSSSNIKITNPTDNIVASECVKQNFDKPNTTETSHKKDNVRLSDSYKTALLHDSDAEIDNVNGENMENLISNSETNPKETSLPDSVDASLEKCIENQNIENVNTVGISKVCENREHKAALLNDSESDTAEPKKISRSGSDTGKIQAPSGDQKDDRTSNSNELDNFALVCNDELKTPPRKKRKHSNSSTPRSKRKHIMESMHAKKMLLTYSSSSDTEDEQLKNVLKDIKDELLKGISSDDEKKDKQNKTCPTESSSGSDEDIVKKLQNIKQSKKCTTKKKQRKISSHTDNSDENSEKMGRSRAQPGGSSQNSDSQDPNEKDIEGLSNLNSLMKNRRRRTSDDTSDTNSLKNVKKMSKSLLINEDNMLKAESSSEAVSAGESDAGEIEEELPPVPLSALNGSGSGHLAKDDLLGESDTSTSHQEKEEEQKDSDDDNNPKSKRRKLHAISSDSEVGSSRKKDHGVKLSDFEDSEDDTSESTKKNKRKTKVDESDASIGSSSNDGSKKKRRRIKQLDESEGSGSGSDTENEGRNKHGRKNIRKVMSKNQLEEATKKAAREEKERIARIAERQKLYNNLEFDESGKPDEVVLEKVVLDFDPETKEPLIEVDRGLVKKLKPHQANGIKFMWDACFESVKRIKKDRGSGCILAHCMGLGKTLQVVSLTHTLLTHSDLTTVNRVLVVCPLSTVLNWVNEFRMWLKHSETEYDVDVYELSRYKQNSERAFQLQQWFENGGVCVLGYEMFRNLSADNPKKFKKKMLKTFQEALVDPGPDLVVCDEGHLLKNEKTSLSQSMNRVRTLRRIVLTGTPLQNNLKEYYCMVQFVKPNLLGKYNEYLNRFVNPITNGQYTDSTEHDIRIMKRRSHVLHKMLDGAVQRRDYGVLAPFLPPKHEYVLFITLTEVQIKLYDHYLEKYSRRPLPGKSSGFLFPDFQSLQRIWTHPLVLKYNSERYEIMQQKKREREEEEDSEGSLADFIDDDSTPDESSTDESSDDLSDGSDDSRKKSKKKKSAKKSKGKESKMSTRRGTRANPVELEEVETTEVPELKAENPTEWWIKLVTDDEVEDMRYSHKLILLFDILRQCETIGDKLLVFSQSLYSLDLIEHFLGKVDEATQDGRIDEKLGGHVGSWSPGIDYFRLDGSTSCENRSIWCKNFNREDNPRARLFLISTRAGGLGINLVAANRVVIFDVSWNPSHDVQSIFRVYRFGQKKPCYIYRFLAMGTMEEKIYERQVTKQAISKRVIDEQQIDRHYAENDLAELYKFEPRPPAPRPLPSLPRDRLFAEMLRERETQIYKYHEHDSLLENKEEETLSEEERKAAWEDFENEKNRPPPAPFPNAWHGMMPGLLAQQQQLAYAALAAMIRKDMPNMNDAQIRDMLPLIYNANPAMFGGYDYGLMQKMSEIYKYAPGAMMNPAMLNPVMNPGGGVPVSGAGSGGGGSSGLQYSPPWQRQHQQQQQMRLQQLMQHQNMGAKYYAGGLGSRDPVAMALQQQRAREIMAGDQRRPRGRPPLPPPAADVVNLDSD